MPIPFDSRIFRHEANVTYALCRELESAGIRFALEARLECDGRTIAADVAILYGEFIVALIEVKRSAGRRRRDEDFVSIQELRYRSLEVPYLMMYGRDAIPQAIQFARRYCQPPPF